MKKHLREHIVREAAAALWAFRDYTSVVVKVKRTGLTPFSPQACTLEFHGETIAAYSAGEMVVGIPAAIVADQMRFRRAIALVQGLVGDGGVRVIVTYGKNRDRTGVSINHTSISDGHTATLYKIGNVLTLQGGENG